MPSSSTTTMRRMRMTRPSLSSKAQQTAATSSLWFKLLFILLLFVVTLLIAPQVVVGGVNAPPPPRHRRIIQQKEGFRRVAIQGSLEPCFQSVHRRLQRRQLQQQQQGSTETLSSNKQQQQQRRRRRLLAASCIQQVQAEQVEIAAILLQAIPTATIVDARQRLVNVQFALVPNAVTNNQVQQIIVSVLLQTTTTNTSSSNTSGSAGQDKVTAAKKKKKKNRVLSSHDFPVVRGGDHHDSSTLLKAAQNDDDIVIIDDDVVTGPITDDDTANNNLLLLPSIFTVATYLGFDDIHQQYCLQGEGIVVAVLDSGIDYTHDVFGGPGTVEAYQAAWGSSSTSTTVDVSNDDVVMEETTTATDEELQKRQQRDGMFPTNVIIEGYDFLGDDKNVNLTDTESFSPDNDPMDGPEGHGTMVASVVMAAAPAVKLLAVKVCNDVQCPDFSVIAGLEYALDPNGDGDTDDAADVANLSIAYKYTDVYFAITAKAMEDAFALGLLIVTVAGNDGNVPYILGYIGGTPNAITVGSTGTPGTIGQGYMADYSSRGPGSVSAQQSDLPFKPDVAAPGGYYLLASAGSGNQGQLSQGSSFSAPFIAGAAAILYQQCGRRRLDLDNDSGGGSNSTNTNTTTTSYDIANRPCSPFSIKAILMNTAMRTIRYHAPSLDGNNGNNTIGGDDENDASILAPISWVGAGEINMTRALDTNVWAYSVDDLQPYLSLGLVNVVEDVTIRKTIRVLNLDNTNSSVMQTLSVSYQFRDAQDEAMGALLIDIVTATITLGGGGEGSVREGTVFLDFKIIANKVPSNHMTSTGQAGYSPKSLDINEFDGWIILTDTDPGKDISLPFYSILRKASHVTVGNNILPPLDGGKPVSVEVNLVNQGAGVAQVDCFELVQISPDDAESDRGSDIPSADLEYVGYRALQVNETDCEYLLEFVAHLWEGQSTFTNTEFRIIFDVDFDLEADKLLANRAPHYHDSLFNMCRVMNASNAMNASTDGVWECTNFAPDHASNSPNIVIRACSDQLSIDKVTGEFLASFGTLTVPGGTGGPADFTGSPNLLGVPMGISTPSFNIGPGETVKSITLWGNASLHSNLGLVCITDAYRSADSTGAATKGTEAFALVFDQIVLPTELTPDVVSFPVATDFRGPGDNWKAFSTCQPSSGSGRFLKAFEKVFYSSDRHRRRRVQDEDSEDFCPEKPFFRPPITDYPASSPTQTHTSTQHPTTTAPGTQHPTTTVPSPTSSPNESPDEPLGAPTQETINLTPFSMTFEASETIPNAALQDLMEGYLFDQISGRLGSLISISIGSVESVRDDSQQQTRQLQNEQSTFIATFSSAGAVFPIPDVPAEDVVLGDQADALNDEAALQFAMARHPYVGQTHAQLKSVVLLENGTTAGQEEEPTSPNENTSSAAAAVASNSKRGGLRMALWAATTLFIVASA